MGLSDGERISMISSAVLIQYTRVTDGRTDGIGVAYTRYSIYAVARKNYNLLNFLVISTRNSCCICECVYGTLCVCQNADELREVAEQLTNQIRLSTGRTPITFLEFDATDPTSSHYDVSMLSLSSFPPSMITMNDG